MAWDLCIKDGGIENLHVSELWSWGSSRETAYYMWDSYQVGSWLEYSGGDSCSSGSIIFSTMSESTDSVAWLIGTAWLKISFKVKKCNWLALSTLQWIRSAAIRNLWRHTLTPDTPMVFITLGRPDFRAMIKWSMELWSCVQKGSLLPQTLAEYKRSRIFLQTFCEWKGNFVDYGETLGVSIETWFEAVIRYLIHTRWMMGIQGKFFFLLTG